MIQDIFPYVYNNSFHPQTPLDTDYVCRVRDGKILLSCTEDTIQFPTVGILRDHKELTYLFSIDDRHFFLDREGDGVPKEYEYCPVSRFRGKGQKHLRFAAVTAVQLANWYQNRSFCGRCGHPLIPGRDERHLECPECGLVEYPKISPAVIVGVINGEQILVTRYAGRTVGMALVAGFAEIGETIEETVRREVMEETGIRVKNITYYKSQPWSFSDTLLFGFYCEAEGDTAITMDEQELSMAEWISREDIQTVPDDLSLTNEMICRFAAGREVLNRKGD